MATDSPLFLGKVSRFSIHTEPVVMTANESPITLRLHWDWDIFECAISLSTGTTAYECDVADESQVNTDCHPPTPSVSTFALSIRNANDLGVGIDSVSVENEGGAVHEIHKFCHRTSLKMNGKIGINPTGWKCRGFDEANEYDGVCIDSKRTNFGNCAEGTDVVGILFGEFEEGLVYPLDALQTTNCSKPTASPETIVSASTTSTEAIAFGASTTRSWAVVLPDFEDTSSPVIGGEVVVNDSMDSMDTMVLVAMAAALAFIWVMVLAVYFVYFRGRRRGWADAVEQQKRAIAVAAADGVQCSICCEDSPSPPVANRMSTVSSISPVGPIPGEVMTDGHGIFTVLGNAGDAEYDDDIDTLAVDNDTLSDLEAVPIEGAGETDQFLEQRADSSDAHSTPGDC